MYRICIVPGKLQGIGGPASFVRKLAAGLERRGIGVTYSLADRPYDAVLVVNGTRQLTKLWRCKRQGIRIVQRLGGINWLHRYLPVGYGGRLLAETRNLNMRFIRAFLADHVVYQSQFVKQWWERKYGPTKVPSAVIYNGVDLSQFTPQGPRYKSAADLCIISVEGTQGADPFDIVITLGQGLKAKGLKVEVLVFGTPWNDVEKRFAENPFVSFKGSVSNADLPYFYRGSSLFVSTDIIAACPNSVLEALSCGTPVLGYKTGVLPELLDETAGRVVECNGDPWKGQPPGNHAGMVSAALELLAARDRFHNGARKLAEERYGLDRMIEAYVEVLQG